MSIWHENGWFVFLFAMFFWVQDKKPEDVSLGVWELMMGPVQYFHFTVKNAHLNLPKCRLHIASFVDVDAIYKTHGFPYHYKHFSTAPNPNEHKNYVLVSFTGTLFLFSALCWCFKEGRAQLLLLLHTHTHTHSCQRGPLRQLKHPKKWGMWR